MSRRSPLARRPLLPPPYPPEWPRRLDFITPLMLQIACGAGDLELFHCVASTSVEAGIRPPSETIRTEFGKLVVVKPYRDRLIYIKNTTSDPTDIENRELISQKEVLNDIVNAYSVRYVGEFPDIVIQERGVAERVPREVESMPQFEGSEDLIYYQKSSGNFTRKYRRALGIRILENPYYFTRAGLWEHGILPPGQRHPILKKIRGVLRTVTLRTDATSWGEIGKDGILALESVRIGERWNLDLGRPVRLVGSLNGVSLGGQIYRLLKRDCFIALEPI